MILSSGQRKHEETSMTEEYRAPSLIKEELSDLAELIRETSQLISLRPKDFVLQQTLHSLKNREDTILNELRETYKRLQVDAFDILIEGDAVRGSSISLFFIGKTLVTLQGLVTSIAKSIREGPTARGPAPHAILEGSRLNLVATSPGSFRVVVSSHIPAIGDSLAKESLKQFNELVSSEDNKDLIKDKIGDLGPIVISKYKNFLGTIYKNNADVKFYDKIRPDSFRALQLSSELAKRIYDVIVSEERIPDETLTYRGIIKGISLISYNFEFLVEETETPIKGTFDEKLYSQVKERFDNVCVARFTLTKQICEITNEITKKWELSGFEDLEDTN